MGIGVQESFKSGFTGAVVGNRSGAMSFIGRRSGQISIQAAAGREKDEVSVGGVLQRLQQCQGGQEIFHSLEHRVVCRRPGSGGASGVINRPAGLQEATDEIKVVEAATMELQLRGMRRLQTSRQ